MPYIYDPIVLTGAIGPGFPNRPEDLARIGPIIEERSGASPFASLPDDGTTDAGGLTPAFRGGIQAFQIATGNDPDGIVLPDGPTLEAMNRRGGGVAPIPKIKATVGSRGPNRPKDLAIAQLNLARVGYAPRVSHPSAPGHRRVDKAAVIRGIRDYQRDHGFEADGFMDRDGETERRLHEQIGRQRRALQVALTEAKQDTIRRARAGEPALKGVTNPAIARSLVGHRIGDEVAWQQAEQRDKVGAVGDDPESHAGAGIGVFLPRPFIVPRPFVPPMRPMPPVGPKPPIVPPLPRRSPTPDADDRESLDRSDQTRKNDPHGGPLSKPSPFKSKKADENKKREDRKPGEASDKRQRPRPGARKSNRAGKRFSARTKREAHLKTMSRCAYCGVRTKNEHGPKKLEYDHSIPVAQGGDNSLTNATPACRTCNRRKGPRTPEQWKSDERRHRRQSRKTKLQGKKGQR